MGRSAHGVVLEGVGGSVKDALRSAARLAFRQVELPATLPEIDPSSLSLSGRRHLRKYMEGLGLDLSALGADLGGARFADSGRIEQRLERTRQIVEMAASMRVPVVTAHLGVIDAGSVREGPWGEVLGILADLADRTGTRLAFETGCASAETLGQVLDTVDCPSLGVCYDPASLLIDGYDPTAGAAAVADRILIARARDAVAGSAERPGRETPLGAGQVDWPSYLATLEQAGYAGVPFLRRCHASQPWPELADAKARLESMLD